MIFHTSIPFRFWVYLACIALAAYNFGANGLIVAVIIMALIS